MKNSIYREKSLDQMSSPEDLNRYMRVTNPPVWFVLSVVIFLMIGFIVGAVFGTLDGTETGVALAENGKTVCYISEDKVGEIAVGKEVKIGGKRYKITEISKTPAVAELMMDEYAMHLGNFQNGQYVYPVFIDAQLETGHYSCQFVTETVTIISFLWN